MGINSSLLVLGKCITALVEEKSHVPYFESKLTMMLKGAFGGNSRTTAIITGSMADEHADETNNALKFGERCSMITNDTKAAAATSVRAAVKAIDQALEACRAGLASLEARGKQHLPSYAKLSERYRQLAAKRKELPVPAGVEAAEAEEGVAVSAEEGPAAAAAPAATRSFGGAGVVQVQVACA